MLNMLSKALINNLTILVTSNKKTQNYKVVDLIESYNFHIKIISIRVRMKKKYDFYKIRPCHVGWVA